MRTTPASEGKAVAANARGRVLERCIEMMLPRLPFLGWWPPRQSQSPGEPRRLHCPSCAARWHPHPFHPFSWTGRVEYGGIGTSARGLRTEDARIEVNEESRAADSSDSAQPRLPNRAHKQNSVQQQLSCDAPRNALPTATTTASLSKTQPPQPSPPAVTTSRSPALPCPQAFHRRPTASSSVPCSSC